MRCGSWSGPAGSPTTRWRRYGPGRSGAWVCAALCATLVVLTPWNTQAGLAFARKRSETAAAFERDVQGGVPVRRMLNRYVPEVHHASRTLRQGLEYMLEARVGVFRHAGEGQH